MSNHDLVLNKLKNLQIVMEMVELREMDTARAMLRQTQVRYECGMPYRFLWQFYAS